MTRFILTTFSILSVLAFAPAQAHADSFSADQKAELKKMLEEYLLNNGEIILQSVNKHQAELEEKGKIAAAAKAKDFMKELEGNTNLPMAGNKDGDITIVEFFDYNCGYCRKALEEIQKVIDKDDKVKVIFMDMPILGEPSLEAAKWSLAAHKQGKYFEYHKALLYHNGQKDEGTLAKLAKKVGLDVKKLKADKDDDGIASMLNTQIAQARSLDINGTPGFIIGGDIYPGYMPADQINKIIADARKK